jgi:subtilisin family serine protease
MRQAPRWGRRAQTFHIVALLVLTLLATSGFGPEGQGLPDLATAPAGGPKLDSSLAQMLGDESAPASVQIIAEADDISSVGAASAAVQAHGGAVEQQFDRLVQATVPVSALADLAGDARVRYVRPPLEPVPAAVESAGTLVIGAPEWHRNGLTGRGVKVAILDTGFDGYLELLGQELPTDAIVKSFRSDGEISGRSKDNHGTASAELVHDVAPGAQLYLVNFGTEVELGNAVDYLIAEKVDIISFSVGYFVTGPGDGTGTVNAIVDRATRAGVLWIVAAGNHAERHWVGPWIDETGDGFLNFEPGAQSNTINAPVDDMISLEMRWDDRFGASCNDYSLGLYDADFRLVASSNNEQSCRQDPVERVTYKVAKGGLHYIAVQLRRAEGRNLFHLFSRNQNLFVYQANRSLTQPADNPHVVTVGAVSIVDGTTVQGYSSRGPTDDGRIKPDLVAPDQVSTASRQRFLGTSASAPHVAGAAAIVKQASSGLTNAQLREFLVGHTTPIAERRPDNSSGFGRLKLGPAPQQGTSSAPIGEQLASIQGKYRSVFGYTPGFGGSTWQAYSPTAPPQANDLAELRVGFGYWVNATEAATITFGGHIWQLLPGWNLIGWY